MNLEGEITAPVSDPEAVIEQVKEMFDLAEEALEQQVDRSQGESAIASRDEERPPRSPVGQNGNGVDRSNGSNGANRVKAAQRQEPQQPRNGNGREAEPATNKQIQFLLNLGKQQRMSKLQLEGRVAEILGCECGIYDLSKQDACAVLDTLTAGNGRRS